MRRISSLFVVVAVVICVGGTVLAQEKAEESKKKQGRARSVKLFNGECLEGWECFSVKDDVKTEDIWSVKDGVLVCKGEPLGYLYTKKDYDNYKLIVTWRWTPGKEPGNSGILLRIAGDAVSFLPKCAECQLKSGSAGDVYGFYGCKLGGPEDRLKIIEHDVLGKIYAVSQLKPVEKKPGKWNTAEITVDGDTISVVINGQEANKVTGCDVKTGRIGLQSEGGEIHFRKVVLTPIKK